MAWFEGKVTTAHRVFYTLSNGPVPAGMCVCHHCDVPACVNPAHLFLGTHADNVKDKCRKGRQHYGEQHPHAKLTARKVEQIRKLWLTGKHTQRALAVRFGVQQPHIHRLVTYKEWKKLPSKEEMIDVARQEVATAVQV